MVISKIDRYEKKGKKHISRHIKNTLLRNHDVKKIKSHKIGGTNF